MAFQNRTVWPKTRWMATLVVYDQHVLDIVVSEYDADFWVIIFCQALSFKGQHTVHCPIQAILFLYDQLKNQKQVQQMSLFYISYCNATVLGDALLVDVCLPAGCPLPVFFVANVFALMWYQSPICSPDTYKNIRLKIPHKPHSIG